MNEKYKYGNLCEKYKMDGDIHIGNGILKVHDIFDKTPDFMKTPTQSSPIRLARNRTLIPFTRKQKKKTN